MMKLVLRCMFWWTEKRVKYGYCTVLIRVKSNDVIDVPNFPTMQRVSVLASLRLTLHDSHLHLCMLNQPTVKMLIFFLDNSAIQEAFYLGNQNTMKIVDERYMRDQYKSSKVKNRTLLIILCLIMFFLPPSVLNDGRL